MAFDYDFVPELKIIIKKLGKKDPKRNEMLHKKVNQIINSDETTIEHYKNLRHDLKEAKRVHIDKHFVLIFEVDDNQKIVRLLDYDHHDKIY